MTSLAWLATSLIIAEAIRIRKGMSKTELAAELGANVDGVRAWMTGRMVGRKETVAKIKNFLKRKSV